MQVEIEEHDGAVEIRPIAGVVEIVQTTESYAVLTRLPLPRRLDVLTRDRKAESTYRRLGVRYHLVD